MEEWVTFVQLIDLYKQRKCEIKIKKFPDESEDNLRIRARILTDAIVDAIKKIDSEHLVQFSLEEKEFVDNHIKYLLEGITKDELEKNCS